MKVIITGASGFVGINLVSYLNDLQYEVQRLKLKYKSDIYIDDDVDTIIHLAGIAHDLNKNISEKEYFQINCQLTEDIYNAFILSKAKKFIFASTISVMGLSPDRVLTENVPPNPQTHYGRSKLCAENFINSQPIPESKSFYILRPSMIHGPGNKGNLNLLNKFISKKLPYPLASFQNKRSFTSVENFCFVIKEIVERGDIPSGIYNVADDEPLSTNEIIEYLSEAHNRPPHFWYVPKYLINFFAKIGDVFGLSLNTARLSKLTKNHIVSNKKIKDVLKKELPLSAREGILITARSFNNA